MIYKLFKDNWTVMINVLDDNKRGKKLHQLQSIKFLNIYKPVFMHKLTSLY